MQEPARVIDITQDVEVKEIKQEIASYVAPITSFKVVDNDTMTRANDTIKEINNRIKQIDQKFEPAVTAAAESKRKAEAARKALDNLITEIKQPLVDVKDYLSKDGKRYLTEQEEIRRAEERRLAEIARKEAEERQLAEAEAAEKEGNHEEAEAIIAEPVYVPAPVVEKSIPKVDNRLFTKRWKGRGVDKMKAVKFIALNPQYLNLLTFDDPAINSMARSMKGQSPVPGIEFFEE
jgi:uncharacterized phage infection (PIP) family protein YhgE